MAYDILDRGWWAHATSPRFSSTYEDLALLLDIDCKRIQFPGSHTVDVGLYLLVLSLLM